MVTGWPFTGEAGYDVSVPTGQHRALLGVLMAAGAVDGLRPFGLRALDSLRLEKGHGLWAREFGQGCTPAMTGLDRYVVFDKASFIGRDAVLREPEPERRMVLLDIEVDGADAAVESVWVDGRCVGTVTSGTFGHTMGLSLALASIEATAVAERASLRATVAGDCRPARILDRPPYDLAGVNVAEAPLRRTVTNH